MTDASITIEDLQGAQPTKIVHISGQLDESNIDSKIQEVYQAVENAPKGLSLIFDLEGLEYMNSKSIGYLTDLYGKITELGGKMMIASAQANIVDILQVVGLTQLIQTFSNLEEAKSQIAPAPEAIPEAPTPVAPVTPPEPAPASAAPVAAPVQAPVPQAAPSTPTPELSIKTQEPSEPQPQPPATNA